MTLLSLGVYVWISATTADPCQRNPVSLCPLHTRLLQPQPVHTSCAPLDVDIWPVRF